MLSSNPSSSTAKILSRARTPSPAKLVQAISANTHWLLDFCRGAVDATYRRYARVAKVLLLYPVAHQLDENVNDKATAGDIATRNGGLGITHRDNALLLHPEKQEALLSSRVPQLIQRTT